MKVKVGDNVKVIAGKDKGKEGKIIKTFKLQNKVVVEGINMVKKHSKPRTNEDKGGIFEIEAPIHVSNVKVVEAKAKTTKTKETKEVKEEKVEKKATKTKTKKTATKTTAKKTTEKKETK